MSFVTGQVCLVVWLHCLPGSAIAVMMECLLFVAMDCPNLDLICWNVRGLNTPARCITVHEMMSQTSCHMACFQETKLAAVDGPLAAYLGGYKHNNFVFKAAAGTRGGILLLWNDSYLELADIHIRRFSITAVVLGDFNIIYRARDKNNSNLNLRRMRQFRSTLSRCDRTA